MMATSVPPIGTGRHGVDELMAFKVNDREFGDLAESQRVARRLADMLVTQPGQIGEGLAAELRCDFAGEQIMQLTLDVMKWNCQKVAAALRVDKGVVPGKLTDVLFDADGQWVRPNCYVSCGSVGGPTKECRRTYVLDSCAQVGDGSRECRQH